MLTEIFIINLLLILSVAWFLGFVFSRFGMPAILGELMAGLVLGPALFDIVHLTSQLELLAELGIFFVMFYAGMEMDPRELLEHIWPSLAAAFGGFALPFVLGFLASRLFGATVYQALFVGMGLSVTAIAVQAVILKNMQIQRTDIGHVIMGAAIADDIFSLITLSVLLGIAESGTISLIDTMALLGKVVLFFGFTILVGEFLVPLFTKKLTDDGGKAFTFALIAALVMAFLAEEAGLHLIIGAFLAGQFVRREIMEEKVYNLISDRFFSISYGFLTPIFFATLGFHFKFEWSFPFLVFAVVITLAAVLGKVLGCGLGAKAAGLSFNESAIIGFGMNGRGAVELVVASVVINLSNDLLAKGAIDEPLLTSSQFSALVCMAFVTTVMTPILLKWSVVRTCAGDESASFCMIWRDAGKRK